MRWWVSALALVAVVEAISYRCENDQVLIVQSFGNDTIRMHCQRLNLCGFKDLKCNYDRDQPSCGGKHNFVSHVNQITATGPVSHTCCELQHENDPEIANHAGNDCFVYELPDGSTDSEKARSRKAHSVDWNELTVLQNVNQVPEQVDSDVSSNVGYRMRLFMLRNKSPPSLIVKAIERLAEGYRVTICRPRCGNFEREGEIKTKEKTDSTKETVTGDILHGKVRSPAEWAAASWSSWSSSTWSSWSTTRYVGDESESAASGTKGRGAVRGDRNRLPVDGDAGSDSDAATSSGTKPSTNGENTAGSIVNNINVNAQGGTGGAGGAGGIGHGGSLNGNAPNGHDAAANNTAIGVGAAGINGNGQLVPASGHGTISPDGNSALTPSQKPDNNGHIAPSTGGSLSPSGKPDENGNIHGANGGALTASGKPGTGNIAPGDGSSLTPSEKSGDIDGLNNGKDLKTSNAGPSNGADNNNGDNTGSKNGKAFTTASDETPDSSDEDRSHNNKAGEVMVEPDGSVQELTKKDENDRAGAKGAGFGAGVGAGNGKGDGKTGISEIEGIDENGKFKMVSGPVKIETDKLSGVKTTNVDDGNNGDGNGAGLGDGAGDGDSNELRSGSGGHGGNGGHGGRGGKGGHGNNEIDSDGDGSSDGDNSGHGGHDGNNGHAGHGGQSGRGGHDADTEDGVGAGAGAGSGSGANGSKSEGDENAGDNNGDSDNSNGPGTSDENNIESSGEGSGEDVLPEGSSGIQPRKPTIEGLEKLVEIEPDNSGDGKIDASNAGSSHVEGSHSGNGNAEGSQGRSSNVEGSQGGSSNVEGSQGGSSNVEGSQGGSSNVGATSSEGGVVKINAFETAETENEIAADSTGTASDSGTDSGSSSSSSSSSSTGSASSSSGASGSAQASPTAQSAAPAAQTPARSCFSGDTEVTTVSGLKRMDELEVGDLVLVPASGNTLKYERVEMFYHREPETIAKFIKIKTASGKTLSLTALHLLPLGKCADLDGVSGTVDAVMQLSRFAHRATVGDCVISVTPTGGLELDPIVSVGRRIEKGIYSPMTVEGAVIANGVLASCFSQIESHFVQKLAFDALTWIYHAAGYLESATSVTTQEVPSMLNVIHQLSQYVLPFAKY